MIDGPDHRDDNGDRLFTQEQVDAIIAREKRKHASRRDLAQAQEDRDRWKSRAVHNLGRIEAMQQIIDQLIQQKGNHHDH